MGLLHFLHAHNNDKGHAIYYGMNLVHDNGLLAMRQFHDKASGHWV